MESLQQVSRDLDDAVSSWRTLGGSTYSLYKLSSSSLGSVLPQDAAFNFACANVAVCPNGGPVAVTARAGVLMEREMRELRENLFVLTGTGCLLGKIPWHNNSPVVAMGFNKEEKLIVVERSGLVSTVNAAEIWEIKVKDIKPFIDECEVKAAKVVGDSIVVVSIKNEVIMIKDTVEWKVTEMCPLYAERNITEFLIDDIVVISKKCSKSETMEIIIPDQTLGFYWIYSGKSVHVTSLTPENNIPLGKIDLLSLIPTNKESVQILAVVFDEQNLYIVMSNDIKGRAIKLKMEGGVPDSISYCGAITLIYQEEVVIVGPDSSTAELEVGCRNGMKGFAEKDGLRLFTSDAVYFLEAVGGKMTDVFALGSKALSSELVKAYQDFVLRNANAEETISELMRRDEEELLEAVKSLISAGSRMWSSAFQKFMFKAVLYTQTWANLAGYDAKLFSLKLQEMRLFNLLRTPKYARLVTYQQYKRLKQREVIDMLRRYHRYYLAIEFSKLFGKEDIGYLYEEWATNLVGRNTKYSEAELYTAIVNRTGDFHDISYKAIAKAAQTAGYLKLATQLLKFTDPIQEQIPLLVSMNRYKEALRIALDDCEYDVVNSILDKMRRQKVSAKETLRIFLEMESAHEGSAKFFFAYAFQQAQLNVEYITTWEVLDCLASFEKSAERHKKLVEKIRKTHLNYLQEHELANQLIHNKKREEVIASGAIILKDSHALPLTKDLVSEHVAYLRLKEKAEKMKTLPPSFAEKETMCESIEALLDSPEHASKINPVLSELGLNKDVASAIKLARLGETSNWPAFELAVQEKHHLPMKVLVRICLRYGNTKLPMELIGRMKEGEAKRELQSLVQSVLNS